MSMSVLTVMQVTVIFILYTILTCCLPFWLLNNRLRGFRLSVKLMLSYVFGNFYLINLVLILQLLHISNPVTLVLGTVVPLFYAKSRLDHWESLKRLKKTWETLKKALKKQLGVKSLMIRIFQWIYNHIRYFVKKCWGAVRRNPLDVLLFSAFTVIVAVMYGKNLISTFGYCTSDIPVHNYWINYMSRGKVFVAGVYPFGFHCVIYYLHAVFRLPTFVLLRVFCFVQTMYIHWMLLIVLKACLRSRYLCYGAAGFYVGSSIFGGSTYLRFFNSLPQEFGMIFILPSIYFGFAFFQHRKEELRQQKQPRRRKKITLSVWCLFGFAMSFGLTLVGHFYDTIIAGLFCVAMAIAFFFRFFTKKYFGRVLLTVFASVAIAVLPMAVAFVTGTPLEGSLNWAMGVISGPSEEEAQEDAQEDAQMSDGQSGDMDVSAGDALATGTAGDSQVTADGQNGTGAASLAEGADGTEPESVRPAPVPLTKRLVRIANEIHHVIRQYVFSGDFRYIQPSVYISMALLVVLSLIYFLLRKPDYAARLLSVSIYMGLLCILIASQNLGLPPLMDSSRTSIYFAYGLPLLWGFAADAVLALFFGWFKRTWILNGVSLAAVALTAGLTVRADLVRTPRVITALETNGAITCLTNIIRENDPWTWTICSPNDELRMGEDYGYHYETIDFLRKLEFRGKHADLTIPTPYIYFFIEKIPLDYYGTYEGSGQSISKEGAKRDLPGGSGLPLYYTENRWILMSRMYYWAQAYQRIYPNEMQVYYESDNFICYRLKQNPANLFDLGIDYGYNNVADAAQ